MSSRIAAFILLAGTLAAADLEGLWQGALQTPGGKLRLGLTVKKAGAGYQATLDSIDQGARGIPVDEIALAENAVTFSMKRLNARFEGKLDAAGKAIEGTFTQGAALPLKLDRVERFEELPRPQEPKGPFPYVAEEVTVENSLVGVKLAGTLTKPMGAGPFPALVLLTGSGPQNRNEELAGHKPFLVLADYLSRRGYAVLRMDDRGVGGSTGRVMDSSLTDLAQDARSAVAFLKVRPDVDGGRIGLLGHSEGGVSAPLAAAESSDVAFLVLLAPTAVPGSDVLLRQNMEILKKAGAPQDAVDRQLAFLQKAVAAIVESEDSASARKNLEPLVESLPEQARAVARTQMATLASTSIRSFLKHDPGPVLRKMKAPALALFGDRDMQVIADQNYELARAALKEAGNAKSDARLMAGLNHLFQTAVTGMPAEYGQIAETMSPRVLEAVGDWLDGVAGKKAMAAITGTVTYRARIALPPDALVEVSLQDVSRADAAAVKLGSQTIKTEGKQVPIPYSISYDESKVDERMRYTVSARITAAGKLIWISDTAHPALTQGAPKDKIEIRVAQAR